MGWWQIRDIESGRVKFKPCKEDHACHVDRLVTGDGPADVMGGCVDKIIGMYKESYGRRPKKAELQAVFNFVTNMRTDESGAVGD